MRPKEKLVRRSKRVWKMERARKDERMLVVIWVIKTVHEVLKIGTRVLPGIWLNFLYVAF